MNKSQLKTLINVNLLYVNPQTTTNARKKGKSGKKLARSLLGGYLFSGIIFLLAYGFIMVMMDFSQLPGYFTYYLALFMILGFSQGISVIYNIFFENQDVQWYLPLPFSQLEIFLAKFVVVAVTIVPFVLPALVLFILTGVRSGIFIGWTLLVSLLLFVLFLVLIFCICSGIVFGMTRTKLFKRHKKTVTSLLLVLSMVISVGGILLMNAQQPDYSSQMQDRTAISFLLPFYQASSQPFTMTGILSLLGLLAFTAIFVAIINKTLVPRFYEQLLSVSTITVAKRKHKGQLTLPQLLRNYNSQLIKEPNLIMQVFSSSLIMPVTFIISFAVSGQFDLRDTSLQFFGVVFFVGVALSIMIVNPMSFVAIMISLDKENFAFIQSLPFSLRTYLSEKFKFALQIQIALSVAIVILAGLVLHLPLLLTLAAILGTTVGTYLLSLRYFSRDYRLLLLDWTNFNQLYTRGSGRWGVALLMVGSTIIAGIALTVYGFAAYALPFWVLDLPIFLVFFIINVLVIRHYKKSFWDKLPA